jgi:rhomboid protease GluP
VSPPSKVCEHCGRLNAADEVNCTRCGTRFPSKVEGKLAHLGRSILGTDTPMVRFYLVLCVAVYLLMMFGGDKVSFFGGPIGSQMLRWGALHPVLALQEPWRILSAVFVHLSILHILMNMSALVSLGAGLERAFGSTRFVITFVGTGIFGFLVSTAWALFGPGAMALTAGASGGLFGLFCFEVGFLYRAGDERWKQALMRVVIAGVIIGLLMSANNAAHAGGGVGGIVMGYLSYRERMWRRFERFWRVLAGVLVVASVASIALCHVSDVWRVEREFERQTRHY